jgi:hypothetical protein
VGVLPRLLIGIAGEASAPLTTQEMALAAEDEVKALLRSLGFTVHGNA